jgi:hypothetical protein
MSKTLAFSLAKDNATGSSPWYLAHGAQRMLLHIHVDSVGATPTTTVKVEATNVVNGNGANVTPIVLNGTGASNGTNATSMVTGAGTTVTATGDTYVALDSFPFENVRLTVSANTNVNVTARLVARYE